ncbi:MAG: cysteine protease StiP family protein [Selenomonadaceae bacterium]|nr:cysteine protease StiP family protein [Selenomonadaceae bacterium]
MFGTYKSEDVTILLKDITGLVTPLDTVTRERFIQSGRHYSAMLPKEYPPSPDYLAAYQRALDSYGQLTAAAVATVAEKIYAAKGKKAVLVSLARAGTPVGILIKRYLQTKHGFSPPHYTISIIRGKGIDGNAMDYLLQRHPAKTLQFVDGWTGKGAIQRELIKAMEDYPGVSPGLAVLSDPACVAEKSGTTRDFLIPSSCLNATVSGLLSRTYLREGIIGAKDFHGAAFYKELQAEDLTNSYIDRIESYWQTADLPLLPTEETADGTGLDEAQKVAAHFQIKDINLVKPSIGEATRVLLRRVPWKILVHSLEDTAHLAHLFQLAAEKGVTVEEYPLRHYKACGLIRSLADT